MRFHKHSNSRKFSITYQNPDHGQILVQLVPTGNGKGLGVNVNFNHQDLGLCSLSLTFGSDPEAKSSQEMAYRFMNRCEETTVADMVAQAIAAAHVSAPERFISTAQPQHH